MLQTGEIIQRTFTYSNSNLEDKTTNGYYAGRDICNFIANELGYGLQCDVTSDEDRNSLEAVLSLDTDSAFPVTFEIRNTPYTYSGATYNTFDFWTNIGKTPSSIHVRGSGNGTNNIYCCVTHACRVTCFKSAIDSNIFGFNITLGRINPQTGTLYITNGSMPLSFTYILRRMTYEDTIVDDEIEIKKNREVYLGFYSDTQVSNVFQIDTHYVVSPVNIANCGRLTQIETAYNMLLPFYNVHTGSVIPNLYFLTVTNASSLMTIAQSLGYKYLTIDEVKYVLLPLSTSMTTGGAQVYYLMAIPIV